jgi:hypothetical protein
MDGKPRGQKLPPVVYTEDFAGCVRCRRQSHMTVDGIRQHLCCVLHDASTRNPCMSCNAGDAGQRSQEDKTKQTQKRLKGQKK